MNWVTSHPAQASASVICTPLAPLPMTPRAPELRKKLTPDYNLGCTRIPKSDKN
jgi:hypothetical protein